MLISALEQFLHTVKPVAYGLCQRAPLGVPFGGFSSNAFHCVSARIVGGGGGGGDDKRAPLETPLMIMSKLKFYNKSRSTKGQNTACSRCERQDLAKKGVRRV